VDVLIPQGPLFFVANRSLVTDTNRIENQTAGFAFVRTVIPNRLVLGFLYGNRLASYYWRTTVSQGIVDLTFHDRLDG
jgi:hypothetical protein